MGHQYKELMDACREQGWELEQTTKGHYKAYPPDKTKGLVVFSISRANHRSYKNALAQLVGAGLVWRDREHSPNSGLRLVEEQGDEEIMAMTSTAPNAHQAQHRAAVVKWVRRVRELSTSSDLNLFTTFLVDAMSDGMSLEDVIEMVGGDL